MKRLVLRPLARVDLDEIWDFIAHDDPNLADSYLEAIRERMHLLSMHPDIGKRCDDVSPGLRRFPFDKYVVFYREDVDAIFVVRILHSARDIDNILG